MTTTLNQANSEGKTFKKEFKKFQNAFCLYHPNKNISGSALQYEDRSYKDKPYSFLSLTTQKSENTFNWDEALGIKIGQNDLMVMAAFFNKQLDGTFDKSQGVKLFHQTENDNTIITMNYNNRGDVTLNVSRKRKDSERKQLLFTFSRPESYAFGIVLNKSIFKTFC